ncbi:NAD(+)/NADH kinase [Microbacterium sp. LWO13-1.2]|uniref:ATP-NAD kinase family protein n=1 Tax=Microbacterium sp. LWO13-1.2 TaxID=3135262 RepID=UPI00313A18D1
MIGLVVNPVAGVGGPAGLAGSDGADVQRLAATRGAHSRAQERTATALAVLRAQHPGLVILTAAGAMGADAVRVAGLVPRVVYAAGSTTAGAAALPTDAADTTAAVAAVAASGADLVLVVGGDGTLRDAAAALVRPRLSGADATAAPFITQEESPELDRSRADSADSGTSFRSHEHPATEAFSWSLSEGALGDRDETRHSASDADPSPSDVYHVQDERTDAGRNAEGSSDIRASVLQVAQEAGMPAATGIVPAAGIVPATGIVAPAVLGIPAGVKMYSPVFAVSPSAAGAIAADWVSQGGLPTADQEVLDIDEAAMRRARVEPVLHGMLRVPFRSGRTQARKAATPTSEAASVAAAARGVVGLMRPGIRYLLGPGGTTAEVARQLGIEGTPLGVDVVLDGVIVCAGASENELLDEIARGPAQAVITVIGGQGFLLGRGNQQLSASVLSRLGDDPLVVVAPEQKLIDLHGRPLIVDTGDLDLDARLSGHIRIVTGVGTSSLYPVIAPELQLAASALNH